MFKYVKSIDEKGLCTGIGEGSNTEKYKAMGMTLKDIEQSEVDGNWYLTEKCPHYTEEEIEEQKTLAQAEEELKEKENALAELKDSMAMADLQGDEDLKAELRKEYAELMNEEEISTDESIDETVNEKGEE